MPEMNGKRLLTS